MKSTLYFKHDLYAIENDSELRYVCSEYPVWGEAVFFKAVSFLYRSNGNEYNKKILVMDVAHGLFTDNKEKVEEIINLCIELGLFKVTDDGKVFSSRVNEACQRQASFNEKQRERINKRWGKDTETVPNENQNDTNGIPTEYQRNTERNTNKQEQEQDTKLYGEYSNVSLSKEQYNKLLGICASEKLLNELINSFSVAIEVGKERPYIAELPNAHYERLKSYYNYRKKNPDQFRDKTKESRAASKIYEPAFIPMSAQEKAEADKARQKFFEVMRAKQLGKDIPV